jgi:hypothetical protein
VSGFSFIKAINSLRSFGGKAAFAMNQTGQSATSDIGARCKLEKSTARQVHGV